MLSSALHPTQTILSAGDLSEEGAAGEEQYLPHNPWPQTVGTDGQKQEEDQPFLGFFFSGQSITTP